MDKHRWTWTKSADVDSVEKLIDVNLVMFDIFVSISDPLNN